MGRRELLGMIGVTGGAYAKPRVLDRFIGVWKLVSCARKFTDGRVEYPYGEKPVGRITYDKAGRMSAQLMRPGRRSSVPPGMNLITGNASTEEIREAVSGFTAYYGEFEVEETSNTVIHHVQAALVPSWVGTDLRRTYRFESNRLLLKVTGAGSSVELIWEKE